MFYPIRWSDYTKTSKKLGLTISEPLSAWASRFRAAKAFKEMSFDDLSEASQRAYFVAQKLTLADIAIEAFERAVDIEVGTLQVFEPDLAYELWDLRQSQLKSLMSTIENRKLRQAFEAFRDLEIGSIHAADLRFVVRAFRHANSHGVFNPAKADLYRATTYSRTLLALADAALAACEAQFVKLLQDGTLACDLNVENKAQHFRNLTQVSSVYVGAIQSIDVTAQGLLIHRLHSPAWQLIDFKSLTLGEISFNKDAMPRPTVKVLESRDAEPHLINLEGIGDSTHVIWQIADDRWLAGNKDCFVLYLPSEKRVLRRFAVPQGVLPSFLNEHKLNLNHDSSGAIVPMWNNTLYLDFETGITKKIDTELWSGAIYAAELDAFVFKDGSSLNLQFRAIRPIDVETKVVGETEILNLVRADRIVDFSDSDTCVVLNSFPAELKTVNLITGESSDISKAQSALALHDKRLLASDGDELALIDSEGIETPILSGVKAELCHYSHLSGKVTIVERYTNQWAIIDTETLGTEKFVQNNFESILTAMALDRGGNILLGAIDGELALSRLQDGNSLFTTSLLDLNMNRASMVVNENESQALIWSKFENLLYCVDIQTGERLGRFEFDSGILDVVWSKPHPLMTLFGEFGVLELELETGDLSKVFDLPNPGISMRLSHDHKSLLVLTTLQSDRYYSTFKSGWLVKCNLT